MAKFVIYSFFTEPDRVPSSPLNPGSVVGPKVWSPHGRSFHASKQFLLLHEQYPRVVTVKRDACREGKCGVQENRGRVKKDLPESLPELGPDLRVPIRFTVAAKMHCGTGHTSYNNLGEDTGTHLIMKIFQVLNHINVCNVSTYLIKGLLYWALCCPILIWINCFLRLLHSCHPGFFFITLLGGHQKVLATFGAPRAAAPMAACSPQEAANLPTPNLYSSCPAFLSPHGQQGLEINPTLA
nr:uncharacterized protein LOC131744198 [Kogia breviceps]